VRFDEQNLSWTSTLGTTRTSRSRQLIQVLRQEFVYSEKRARDIIFNELEAIIRRSEGLMIVSRLTREAAARARAVGQQIGFDLGSWEMAAKATVNAMLAAGVLLGINGRSIPLTIAAQATDVANLVPDFRNITEVYLLELLIRKVGDLTARDHTALAHALFRQFDPSVPMEDMEDRVAHLLARLADRVAISEGGGYYIIEHR